jgi:hypothetical protein
MFDRKNFQSAKRLAAFLLQKAPKFDREAPGAFADQIATITV